jgi:hypothetical protein
MSEQSIDQHSLPLAEIGDTLNTPSAASAASTPVPATPGISPAESAQPRAEELPTERKTHLTAGRAFGWFVVCFALGIGSIFGAAVWPPLTWISILPLGVYGLRLVLAQWKQGALLSGTVKDSPYFLGFLLTMVALAKVFMGVAKAEPGTVQVGQVVGEAGAAILATVVGLFLRQLTLSLDRAENMHDAAFQHALDQLKEGALELEKSQLALARFVQTFVSTRTQLSNAETKALQAYVDQLQSGTGVLGRAETAYAERVETLLKNLDAATGRFNTAVNDSASKIEEATTGLANTVQAEIATARKRLADSGNELVTARDQAVGNLRSVVSVFAEILPKIQTHATSFETTAARFPAASQKVTTALEELAGKANAARAELTPMITETRAAAAALKTATSAIATDTNQVATSVSARAKALENELQAIDAVIDEFVEVMRARMKNGSATRTA